MASLCLRIRNQGRQRLPLRTIKQEAEEDSYAGSDVLRLLYALSLSQRSHRVQPDPDPSTLANSSHGGFYDSAGGRSKLLRTTSHYYCC